MRAVHDALAPLDPAQVPREERELVRLPKPRGRELVARLTVHKGQAGLDLRDWVGGAYTGWSRKGIRLPYERLPEARRLLARMEVFFRGPGGR